METTRVINKMEIPDWANYMAQDCTGWWYVYENKPIRNLIPLGQIWSPQGGKFYRVGLRGGVNPNLYELYWEYYYKEG